LNPNGLAESHFVSNVNHSHSCV